MTLRTRGFLLIGLIIVISLGLTGYYHLRFLEKTLRHSIYEGLASINATNSKTISHFLKASHASTQTIAMTISPNAVANRDLFRIEKQLAATAQYITRFENGMFVLDNQGILLADYPTHPEVHGINYAHRQYFQATMAKGEGVIGTPYISSRTKEPVLTFTAPLKDREGNILGILGCSVQLTSPNALEGIRQTVIGESGYIYLYDHSRLMILHPQNDRILKRDVPPGRNKLFDAAIEGFQGVGETVNSRGVSMLATFTHVPDTEWILVAQQPTQEALASIAGARIRLLLSMGVAVIISLLVSALAITRITHPLQRLRNAAVSLGALGKRDLLDESQTREQADFKVETYQGLQEIDELAQSLWDLYTQLVSATNARILAVEDKMRLENQLKRAQKMEAIGTLAGGIAHDFNNILSAIIGYTEIALEDLPPESETAENLREVFKAGRRAKSLVRQILTFSRQSEPEFKPAEVGTIVKEALELIRATIPTTIAIKQDIRSEATVLADPTQIHQVIMNLATNAAHAMEEQGGELAVTLEETRLQTPVTGDGSELPPGRYLILTMSDTGSGIPPEIQERIFDPFFTTKGRQHGTGMGLAVVHGIVTSHHGAVTLESTPGQGTRFQIYLPIAEIDEVQRTAGRIKIEGGNERILAIDDEPSITDMIKQILERLGYQVTTQSDSTAALDHFRENPQAYDLVITDMTMPQLTGDRVAATMLEIRPELPIILCTGYTKQVTEAQIRQIGIRHLIYKPMAMNELARIIRQTLDNAPDADPEP